MPGGLEFQRYASLIGQQLEARGYRIASSQQGANMIVHLGYNVDSGQTRVSDYGPYFGGYGGYRGYYGGFYRPRFGWGSPFYYGWDDPFWYGSSLDSYVEYHSEVDLHIRAAGSGLPLFDGRAEARSTTNRLDYLLPGLIDALFTGFPGQNGEVVRITIPPRQGTQAAHY